MVITVACVEGGWSVTSGPDTDAAVWARGADAYDAALVLAHEQQRRGGEATVRVAALGSAVDVVRLGSAESHGAVQ